MNFLVVKNRHVLYSKYIEWQIDSILLNFHNRKYKDRLFQRVFQDKRNLLDLYNAINGTNHQDPEELEITTLHMLLTEFDEKNLPSPCGRKATNPDTQRGVSLDMKMS